MKYKSDGFQWIVGICNDQVLLKQLFFVSLEVQQQVMALA
jgi:hypothetical protein